MDYIEKKAKKLGLKLTKSDNFMKILNGTNEWIIFLEKNEFVLLHKNLYYTKKKSSVQFDGYHIQRKYNINNNPDKVVNDIIEYIYVHDKNKISKDIHKNSKSRMDRLFEQIEKK